jgi:hypothetical protein
VYANRKWRATYGYGFAMVVAFGEKPVAVSMCPFGASEDSKSPHYADQLDLMAERRFKVTSFEFDDVQRNATRARGRQLLLRPKGMEALFTIRAATPIEARLNASSEPPTPLPEDLVPFTLFVATEQAPRGAPTSTHMEVYVPPVLCARENLDKLAVYAGDAPRGWTRLEAQQLDLEARTFIADDNRGPKAYAVLGPSLYRATRLPSPTDNGAPKGPEKLVTPVLETGPLETANPPKAEPEASSNGLSAEEEPPRPSKKSKVTWGSPPKQKARPLVSPDSDEAPDLEPPELDLKAPEAPTEEAKSTGNNVDQKQTKKEKRSRKSPASTAQDKGKNVKRNFNLGPPAQQQNPSRKAR